MLKLNIPESEDWKTDTDNNMINCFRELMTQNNEYQGGKRLIQGIKEQLPRTCIF